MKPAGYSCYLFGISIFRVRHPIVPSTIPRYLTTYFVLSCYFIFKLFCKQNQIPYRQLGIARIVGTAPTIVGSRPPIVKASLLASFFGSNFSRFLFSIAFVSTSSFDSTFPLNRSPPMSLMSLVCSCSSFSLINEVFLWKRSLSRLCIRSCCSLVITYAERRRSISCNCLSFYLIISR